MDPLYVHACLRVPVCVCTLAVKRHIPLAGWGLLFLGAIKHMMLTASYNSHPLSWSWGFVNSSERQWMAWITPPPQKKALLWQCAHGKWHGTQDKVVSYVKVHRALNTWSTNRHVRNRLHFGNDSGLRVRDGVELERLPVRTNERVVSFTELNFEYNDRRKKIIPNKVQTKYPRASNVATELNWRQVNNNKNWTERSGTKSTAYSKWD